MIEVENLRKTYGNFVAVRGSDFSVDRGEIFGVVGPNGAGKTTTLKMLAGLIEPTDGEATLAGYDAGDPEMRSTLGFLPEESPLYEDMTPLSYLHFFADLYSVPSDVASERIDDALDRLELEHCERRLGDMSKGMKRKVAIARSLVNDPDILIYDEPASGLDPLTTNYVLEFTRELSEAGKTVIFSAHNLYHIESICDRVIIMNRGEIVARGSVPEIREEHGYTEYHVTTTVPVEGAEVLSVAGGSRGGSDADETDETDAYRVVVDSMDEVRRIREAAESTGGTVADIRTEEPSLEDIFLDLAKRPASYDRTVSGESRRDHEPTTTAPSEDGR
jgi:ABC-2 type transport system ATP-binding protein